MDSALFARFLIRATSLKGVAEEAPGAYKDIDRVAEVAHQAGLARKVARLEPLICVKVSDHGGHKVSGYRVPQVAASGTAMRTSVRDGPIAARCGAL